MTSTPFPAPPSPDLPPAPPQPGRPPLRRSGTDRMLGGVSGGLAEHTGIDAVLWRVGFVALTLAGGSGILLYLLLWVLLPSGPLRPGDEPRPVDRAVDRLHTAVSTLGTTPRQR
ncbi:PspC domain-containing protein [Blastococcus sp. CT_GayMR20]|uniref:PspC domain-containing protein n=1 Tax=Blastococcus sp. CT_GayMR20 TaxID=2559609 RepID=UPI0010747E10|nr:PspC domain-containing protein [Blastococcus sp. CT_GayMR20]TFV91942.1 PspC domain-containing protein [Blastococcus sp. CT_GayMR20]TFV91981.1 PspC domain-containing protein [Blastococcus sp. CT_GayMR20]